MGWPSNARWAGVLALLVALVAAARALSHRQAARGEAWAREVAATAERIGALVARLSILQDAEPGQRGCLITSLDGYLEPCGAAPLWLAAREMRAAQRADAPVRHLASHDPLTGPPLNAWASWAARPHPRPAVGARPAAG